jgi:hypothetical protein
VGQETTKDIRKLFDVLADINIEINESNEFKSIFKKFSIISSPSKEQFDAFKDTYGNKWMQGITRIFMCEYVRESRTTEPGMFDPFNESAETFFDKKELM